MAQRKRGPGQLRIGSGKWKGRPLRFSGDHSLRPTLGRVRETLFNWVRGELPGATVLDAFAGSGALGFEALSLGAAHATFVDRNRLVCQHLRTNAAALEATAQVTIRCQDTLRFLRTQTDPFDLIFLDPPFNQADLLSNSLKLVCERQLARALIYAEAAEMGVIESAAAQSGYEISKSTRAGDTAAALLTC